MSTPIEGMNCINDICLFVEDFQGSLDYFTNVFGFRVTRLQPNPQQANYAEFEFQGTSMTIWNIQNVKEDALDESFLGTASSHKFMIAIKVDKPEQVTRIYNELVERGAKVAKEPVDYPFGSRACYMRDHEDNIWEIFAWLETGNGPGLLK